MKAPYWLKLLCWVLWGLFAICALYVAIQYGYDQSWTGFQGYTNNKGEFIQAKKLWDWLQLLIVPVILALGAWLLNRSQKKSEQRLETDRQRQRALEDYFECMTDLLLNHGLRKRDKDEVRSVARTRTLAALRTLDGERKAEALQFLYESGLISVDPIISLTGADLSEANLVGSTLRKAEIRGAHFQNADLSQAILDEALLTGSNFSGACLQDASMNNAYLVQATFDDADLRRASMRRANLNEATFRNAELSEADFDGATGSYIDSCGADWKKAKHFPKGDKNGATVSQV